MTVVRLSDYHSSRGDLSPPCGSRAVEGSASQQGEPSGAVVAFPGNGGPASSLMEAAMLGSLTLLLECYVGQREASPVPRGAKGR
jgi:hypothetical protein